MEIRLKGQAAIDAAKKAMRERTVIEMFGMDYVVEDVTTVERSISENVYGVAGLRCQTRHADVRSK